MSLGGLFVLLTLILAVSALHRHLAQRTAVLQTAQAFQFSPYIDVGLAIERGLPWDGVAFGIHSPATIDPAALATLPALRSVTLAFATGECGKEQWGGFDAQRLVQANLAALQRANLGYIIATGGARAPFHCNDSQGMETFVQRYASSHLLGFDFDIETGMTEAEMRSLVREVRRAVDRHPHLRFSFTIAATAVEGDSGGVNDTGRSVLQALADAGLTRVFVNLMVMNYGDPSAGSCVVREGHCDMVASAMRAVEQVHRHYRIPYSRIEVTPMIGVNDVPHNVFTPEDAVALREAAQERGLGGLHYWSLNRDIPCADPASPTSALCHGLPTIGNMDFARLLSGSVSARDAATDAQPCIDGSR